MQSVDFVILEAAIVIRVCEKPTLQAYKKDKWNGHSGVPCIWGASHIQLKNHVIRTDLGKRGKIQLIADRTKMEIRKKKTHKKQKSDSPSSWH